MGVDSTANHSYFYRGICVFDLIDNLNPLLILVRSNAGPEAMMILNESLKIFRTSNFREIKGISTNSKKIGKKLILF